MGVACVLAFAKRFRAAEHQHTAAAFGHELLHEHHLVAREKVRFQIVHDDGVILVKVFGCFGKPPSIRIRLSCSNERARADRSVRVLIRVAEPAVERITRLAAPPHELELLLAPRNAINATS